ncbi:hypothetical protein DdX_22367 [Ditylenchus destructor]|uniref:Uncharacterized protein n=1 Tax=Ditylenchus destructor TaxID=166010 RepID=A0AAD4MDN6_9BILA|nr:hypothetical protein DdX_22367 [Ditylenchus destructor]
MPHTPLGKKPRAPCTAPRRLRTAPDHVGAQDDERHDGADLDGREPVLDSAERLHAHGVDEDQRRREQADPLPARHRREPELHVLGHRGDLGAHRQHHARPVRLAHQEAGQRADVVLGVGAERARGGMRHRHLGQAAISSSVMSPPMA